MTEDEAKTKWCPLSRQLSSDGKGLGAIFAAVNRNFSEKGEMEFATSRTNCVASACMMWRRSHPDLKGNGYCGLAGKP